MATIGLTRKQLQARTNLVGLRQATDEDTVDYWISVAEALIDAIDLDSSIAGYSINMLFIVQKVVEHLWINNDEQVTIAANVPFRSQKLGSFSYQLSPVQERPDIFDNMPPIVKAIIRRYTKVPTQMTVTTPVFPQVDPDINGVVEYHDFLSHITNKDRDLFNLADIVNR